MHVHRSRITLPFFVALAVGYAAGFLGAGWLLDRLLGLPARGTGAEAVAGGFVFSVTAGGATLLVDWLSG